MTATTENMSRRYINNNCSIPLITREMPIQTTMTYQYTPTRTSIAFLIPITKHLVSGRCKGGRAYLGSHFEGIYSPTSGEGMAGEEAPGCSSSNTRLLAHISMDQEAEIKTGSRARLESSALPVPIPQAPLPKGLPQQHCPSARDQVSAHHISLCEYILYLYRNILLLAPMGSEPCHNAKGI